MPRLSEGGRPSGMSRSGGDRKVMARTPGLPSYAFTITSVGLRMHTLIGPLTVSQWLNTITVAQAQP